MNFADYSDTPLYNTQAVARAAGIPVTTLRSWERRYGFPQPLRDAQGRRRYSDRDLAMITWLSDRVRAGFGIRQAVALLESIISGQELAAPMPRHPSTEPNLTYLTVRTGFPDSTGAARVVEMGTALFPQLVHLPIGHAIGLLAGQGWELVAIDPTHPPGYPGALYIFKKVQTPNDGGDSERTGRAE